MLSSILALKSQHLRILFWLFLVFISYKFLSPSSHSGIEIPHLDKLVHLGIFLLLTGLLHQAYRIMPWQQLGIWAIYGGLIEYLQGLTGYRSADILDWIADILGVVIALLLLHYHGKMTK